MAILRGPAQLPAQRELTTTAISASIAASAVDVFVYDTRKDSDGGAWRKRCQHTSWYNETLNTATRGARREFPAVAVIVATANDITIYDGDDPDLPMWMVFGTTSSGCMLRSGLITSVTMLNGEMWVGHNSGSGAHWINFLKDTARWLSGSSSYGGYFIGKTISNRNWTGGNYYNNVSGASDIVLIGSNILDVAMTVVSGAPIDSGTGLPIPTVALATSVGMSVIRHDGACNNHNIFDYVFRNVEFNKDGNIWAVVEYSGVGACVVLLPLVSQNYSLAWYSKLAMIEAQGWSSTIQFYYPTDFNKLAVEKNSRFVNFGTKQNGYGVVKYTESAANNMSNVLLSPYHGEERTDAMAAVISTQYNTGWMSGAIRGAWLCSTVQETLVGSGELITNGDFSNGTTGWTISNASEGSISVSGGVLTITNNNSSDPPVYAYQAISTVVGKTYTVGVSKTGGTLGEFALIASTTTATSDAISQQASNTSSYGLTISFVATTTTTYILLRVNINAAGTVTIDNVTCKLSEPDRSGLSRGLQVIGSITKSPVATGSDLMAYSGFSTSNYFKQPPNFMMDYSPVSGRDGSGSYSVALWAKTTSAGIAIGRGVADANESMNVYLDPATYGVYFDYGNEGQYAFAPNSKSVVCDGNWHFIVCHVTFGQVGSIWVDGVKQSVTGNVASTTFLNSSEWEMYVGIGRQPQQPLPFPGSLALVRLSATVLSPQQIVKMYNDEKMLFVENSKASLYGSSDVVNAVAYDETTNYLHVGTSSGRSVFQGLNRIDYTTTPVTTQISVSNGFVAEQ